MLSRDMVCMQRERLEEALWSMYLLPLPYVYGPVTP